MQVCAAALVEVNADALGLLPVNGAQDAVEPPRDVLAGSAQRGGEASVRELVHGDPASPYANGDVHGKHGCCLTDKRGLARDAKGATVLAARWSGSRAAGKGNATRERMQQPPQQQVSREEELVDEAGVETFPASDAPGWNPTHAGAPAHERGLMAEHGHEVLRTLLRADVERLSRPCADVEQRRRAREEIVSRALLAAGRAVVREPVDEALRVRTLESEQLGAMREASCVIFAARYDGDDISGIAALLALSRGLNHARLRRNVRFVAFADAAPVSGCARYAERLWTGGVGVQAMVSLARLDLARDHEASLLFVGNLRSRRLVHACVDVFEMASRIGARALAVPSWMPGVRAADHAPFREHGWPAMMVADGPPWRRVRSAGAPDVDRIAAAVPGLVAVAIRLAGGV